MREAGPTCQVQCERDEAVVASQELQRFLSLHQGAEIVCHSFPVKEVVDANQEVPDGRGGGKEEMDSFFLCLLLNFSASLPLLRIVCSTST